MVEYVKGPEPDRWHWYTSCSQYPRIAIARRINRPSSDLCDECLDIETREAWTRRKAAATA